MKLLHYVLPMLVACQGIDQKKIDVQARSSSAPALKLAYEPEMIAPYVISRSHFEGHASITPAEDELYFAVYTNDHSYSTIAFSNKENGQWQEPKIAPFSGNYSDGSPALSPDGKKLFFSSNRPGNSGAAPNTSPDLWSVERTGNAWGSPVRLPETINSSFTEFSPSVDQNGNLYFCSNRPGGFGDMDVYYSQLINETYQESVLLDSLINSPYHEGNVGVSPDGNLLFVMIQHKPGDFGYDDIHFSIRSANGWSPVKNVGSEVNTYTYDFSPKVAPDGNTLYFSSRISRDYVAPEEPYTFATYESYLHSPLNGLGNIYKIELSQLKLDYE